MQMEFELVVKTRGRTINAELDNIIGLLLCIIYMRYYLQRHKRLFMFAEGKWPRGEAEFSLT